MVRRGSALNLLSSHPLRQRLHTSKPLYYRNCVVSDTFYICFFFFSENKFRIQDHYLPSFPIFQEAVVHSTDVMDSTSDPDLLSPFRWAMKCVSFLTVVSHISLMGLRSIGCPQETRGAAEEPTVPSCGGKAVVASLKKAASIMAVWRAS